MIPVEEMTGLPTPTATSTPTSMPSIIPLPGSYHEMIGGDGKRTSWVLFALMLLFSGVFALLSWNVPVSKRIYHVTTTLTTIIATLAYFAIATGQSSVFSCETVWDRHDKVPDTHHDVCRQVFWARYVDWALTTPLLILNLSLLAGIDGAHTLMAIVANVIMMLSGLFSAFGSNGVQRWGWFVIACFAYLFTLWHVALHGTNTVSAKGAGVSRLFGSLGIFALLLWTAYPIVWGIADAAHKVSVDTEIMIYAVLDILAKPIFGLWLLLSHRSMAETNIDLGGYWSHGLASQGRIRIGDEE